jgi:hypothetical protein
MSLKETINRAKNGSADDQRKLILLAAVVIAAVVIFCLSFLDKPTQDCIIDQGVINRQFFNKTDCP